jgi:tetratricopeptide (TPR) repeat protein
MDDATPMDAASYAAHLPELRAHAEDTFAQALESNVPERWREAVAAYQQLVAHNSTQGEYWWRLAVSQDHLDAFSAAQDAYQQALALGTYRPWALFVLGRLCARFGYLDEAISWLTQAIEARLGFVTDLQTDSAFDSLRADPRFLDLLPPVVPEDTLREEGWRIDLAYLARRLEQAHYDLFRQVSREAWRTAVSDLRERLPVLADHETVAALMRLVVFAGDGHTYIYPGGDLQPYPAQIQYVFERVPVMFYQFSDGLHIMAAATPYRELAGARVLSIGKFPAADSLAALDSITAKDNPMTLRWLGPFLLTHPHLLHALGITDTSDRLTLSVATVDGGTATVTVPAEPRSEGLHYRTPPAEWITMRADPAAPLPFWLRDPNNPYWFDYLAGERVVYCQYSQVQHKEDEPQDAFWDRLCGFIATHDVEVLVVELRLNNGGNAMLNQLLIHQLIRATHINQPGRLFTIIGRRTFSAAMHLSAQLALHTHTLFVGEPTGSRPNFVGEENQFRLPYSGLIVSASNLYHQGSDPWDQRIWIAPDISAELSADDMRMDHDPALAAILAYLGYR